MAAFSYVLSIMVVCPVVSQFSVDDWHDPHGTTEKKKAPLAAMNLIRHATHTKNPLLQYARFPSIKPPFDKIENKNIMPAIKHVLEDSYKKLRALEAQCESEDFVPSGQTLVDPAELLTDELDTAWSLVLHLSQTTDSEELRVAVRHMKLKIAEFNQAFSQSIPIYQAFKKLKRGQHFDELAPSQKRIVLNMIRDLKLGGAELAGVARERFNHNAQRLVELSQKFSENVIDSRNAYQRVVTKEAVLAGVPKSVRKMLSLNAKKAGLRDRADAEDGPWLITLDSAVLTPVLMYCRNRKLRKELYLARIGLASDLQDKKYDNGPISKEILNIRQKQAKLLGYESYGHLSLSKKMANNPSNAEKTLQELVTAARPKAQAELEDLTKYAKGLDGPDKLKGDQIMPWDISFYGSMQKKQLFNVDNEDIRQYFPLDKVLSGMFQLARRLFAVRVSKVKSGIPVWHPDVQVFLVQPDQANDQGILYMDLFSRPGKRGGAWTSNIRPSCGDDLGVKREMRTAVASINANFRPPEVPESADESIDPFEVHSFSNLTKATALLSYDEVHTLFHEFGHALQHLLSTEEDASVSGLHGIEYDALETASQFMEYWLEEGPAWVVKSISSWEGDDSKFDESHSLWKVKQAMKYHRGMDLLGQAHLALVDLDLHTKPLTKLESIDQREAAVAATMQTRVLPQLEEDRHLNSFSHIFSGNDAAGYYSHKWAEVLAADAFAAFEDTGAFNDGSEGERILSNVGKRFAGTILAHGGGRHPAEVFKMFRQRGPTVKALMRYSFGRDAVAGENAKEPLILEDAMGGMNGRRLTDL